VGLRDEIMTLNTARPNRRCVVAMVLADLPDDDAADLRAALDDDSITHKAIAAALIGRGYDVGHNAKQIARHRKRECGCD
jgi:hypothetical protein